MIFVIIVFFIAVITALGILSYRAWEIRSEQPVIIYTIQDPISKISFKKLEKIVLTFLKIYIQKLILLLAKYWFLLIAKTKKFLMEKWPKFYNFFQKKPIDPANPPKPSFFTRALLESKYKIKHLKRKIHEDHDLEY